MSDKTTKKILKIIIVTYPIWDIIYSISYKILNINIPINQVGRVLIMIFFLTKIRKGKDIGVIFLLFLLLAVGEINYLYFSNDFLTGNLAYVLKILFFVIIIFGVENIIKSNIIEIDDLINYIVISSLIITISIILSIFGIGFSSWEGGLRSGYKGLFTGQNIITVTLLVINPLSFYMMYKTRKILYFAYYFLIFISLFVIGTKAGLVGALGMLIIQVVLIFKKTKTSYLKVILSVFLCLFAFLIIYLSVGFLREFINEQKNIYYAFGYNDIFSFMVSNRNLQIYYLRTYINTYFNYNPLCFFGIGYNEANTVINLGKSEFQAIEMDLYGILYYSGVWVLIIICTLIIKRVYLSYKLMAKSRFTLKNCSIFLSIIIGCIHAIWGGHVIYEALTSLYFGSVLAIAKIRYDNMDGLVR